MEEEAVGVGVWVGLVVLKGHVVVVEVRGLRRWWWWREEGWECLRVRALSIFESWESVCGGGGV